LARRTVNRPTRSCRDGSLAPCSNGTPPSNSPITVELIFVENAAFDLEAATTSINAAIEGGSVSVSVVIDGVTITATVTEAAIAVAAVDIEDQNGMADGIVALYVSAACAFVVEPATNDHHCRHAGCLGLGIDSFGSFS
jgi:hypothetical protein